MLAVIAAAVVAPASPAAAWTLLGGGDHGNADWVISADSAVSGYHYNVATFRVNSGVTASIQAYDGANYGRLTVSANDIDVQGAINGIAAGYGGGGGGGGSKGYAGYTCPSAQECGIWRGVCYPGGGGSGTRGGQNGGSAWLQNPCSSCNNNWGGQGGTGGGPAGGVPAVAAVASGGIPWGCACPSGYKANGGAGGAGGYASPSANGDLSVEETILMGSGGAGGGGGAGSLEGFGWSQGGSGGGGAGNPGGGAVRLIATGSVNVTGSIILSGLANSAGNGSNGQDGPIAGNCDNSGAGGSGGSASAAGSSAPGGGSYSYAACANGCAGWCGDACDLLGGWFVGTVDGGSGGSGGSGGGGGILLKAYGSSALAVSGSIDARGGIGTGNGGSVKLFYDGSYSVAGTVQSGRLFARTIPSEVKITSANGSVLAVFTSEGHISTIGRVYTGQGSITSTGGDFVVMNNTGTVVALFKGGDIFLRGGVYQNQPVLSPSGSTFLVRDGGGNVVAYISQTGDLYLRSTLAMY